LKRCLPEEEAGSENLGPLGVTSGFAAVPFWRVFPCPSAYRQEHPSLSQITLHPSIPTRHKTTGCCYLD